MENTIKLVTLTVTDLKSVKIIEPTNIKDSPKVITCKIDGDNRRVLREQTEKVRWAVQEHSPIIALYMWTYVPETAIPQLEEAALKNIEEREETLKKLKGAYE